MKRHIKSRHWLNTQAARECLKISIDKEDKETQIICNVIKECAEMHMEGYDYLSPEQRLAIRKHNADILPIESA